MIPDIKAELVREFEAIVGSAGIVTEQDRLAPHLAEPRGLFHGKASVMVMPATTDEAAAVIRLCHRHRIGVVPQGGNTGLVGGAMIQSSVDAPQLLLSASRLTKVRELDAPNYTVTAEAGCILADLQRRAQDADRLFPLSLAAEGSCQLGGNLSTNAGGTNVLRFGNARDLVLGLEVVLPDGRVFEALRGLRKNNTGYDLKHLFIGAEGTLGFITAATLKLFPQPGGVATALVAVKDPESAVALYDQARSKLGDELVAFELLSRLALELALASQDESRDPLDEPYPWYVLMELASARDHQTTENAIESFMHECLEGGIVQNGVVAQSEIQREHLWQLRHLVSEAQGRLGASIKHDISVPVSKIAVFIQQAVARVQELAAGCRVVAFGHLGDGNIHFNVSQPEDLSAEAFLDQWEVVNREVHGIAVALGGSFSAEHGIGLLKLDELKYFGHNVELALMKTVKAALDPDGIMNPGKLPGG